MKKSFMPEIESDEVVVNVVLPEGAPYSRALEILAQLLGLLVEVVADQAPDGAAARQVLWIVSWGFEVPRQLRALRGRAVAYHAHSSGYGFPLPAGVPVLARVAAILLPM